MQIQVTKKCRNQEKTAVQAFCIGIQNGQNSIQTRAFQPGHVGSIPITRFSFVFKGLGGIGASQIIALHTRSVGYDQYGNLCKFRETVAGNETHTTNFTYDEENRPTVLT